MATLGAWLQAQRVEQGWSQYELARRLHITQAHMSRLEKDQRHPSPELCYALARVFDTDPAQVFALAFPDRPADAPLPPDPGDPAAVAALTDLAQLAGQLRPAEWAILVELARLFVRRSEP